MDSWGNIDMNRPIVAGHTPVAVSLTKGEAYDFCVCEKSESQPFGEGSHAGTFLSHTCRYRHLFRGGNIFLKRRLSSCRLWRGPAGMTRSGRSLGTAEQPGIATWLCYQV
jgi:hypothetical protein